MAELDAARDELVAALGADAVLHDPLALRLYARDASMVEGSAGLVVFVRSAEDVVVCMRVAARHDLPVVPRGSGAGLAGGGTPRPGADRVGPPQNGPVPPGPPPGPLPRGGPPALSPR